MKPYRGTLLAAAVLLAALPLSGCGDADRFLETTDITLKATPASVEVKQLVSVTVQSPAPAEGYECDTSLQYRAQGAGFDVVWAEVPGTGTTRVFGMYPRREGTLSMIARGKCIGAKEDWKYSAQVDVAVTPKTVVEPVLPTPTSVTLTPITASPYSLAAGGGVDFTLSAVAPIGCTLVLSRQHSGAGVLEASPVNPTSPGNKNLTPTVVGTLTISASAWCTENTAAIVSATPLAIAVVL